MAAHIKVLLQAPLLSKAGRALGVFCVAILCLQGKPKHVSCWFVLHRDSVIDCWSYGQTESLSAQLACNQCIKYMYLLDPIFRVGVLRRQCL